MIKYKSITHKGQTIKFHRDKEIVMAYILPINEYDGKPKHYDYGATKKEAFENIKKKLRLTR